MDDYKYRFDAPMLVQDNYQFSEDEIIHLMMNTNLLEAIFKHYPPEDLFEMIKDKVSTSKSNEFYSFPDVLSEGLKNWSGTDAELQDVLLEYPDFIELLAEPNKDLSKQLEMLDMNWVMNCTGVDIPDLITEIKRHFLNNFDVQDFIKQVLEDPDRAMIP